MPEPDLIDDYLDGLARGLRALGRRQRRRLLTEAAEHLRDLAASEMEDGMDPTDAQHAAIARFGSAEDVAAGLGPPSLVRRAAPLLVAGVGALTVLAGAMYGFGQQGLRQEANDPQVPIAHDVAGRLSAGASAAEVASGPAVDLASDPRVHVTVFDASGGVILSTARLDGRQPAPPLGVLAAARAKGENAVTWQPRRGVRVAAVVVPWTGGTVLVGRSMARVERDEDLLLRAVAAGWLVAAGLTAAAALGWAWWRGPRGAGPALAPAPAT